MINSTLKKNLDAIRKFYNHPELANKIENPIKEPWWEVTTDKNLLINKRNKMIAAYPLKDPDKEAIEISKQNIYSKDGCSVIIGMGLGYLPHAILKNGEYGHRVIVVEPVLGLIHEAFSRHDFSQFIEAGRLMVATSKEEVGIAVAEMDAIYVIQNWISIAERYIMACEEYAELLPLTMEILNQERCNTGTVMGAGAIIAENDIRNLPYCIRHRGVAELKDLYKGKPAVTVNTGPSLAKNIHLLKDCQDKVIIIAVAQALRVLLAYDIKPDFICTVDYGEVNYEHFRGIMDSDVPLIALNRTYAPILKEWQGTKFITVSPNPGFENSVAGVLYDKGAIEAGGSVSHLAFGIAYHLGCNPITTIGLDLAYSPDFKSHIAQVDAGGKVEVDKNGQIKWQIKDPRSSLKDKEHPMGAVLYVPDHFGGLVPTNVGLASFITSFERIYEGIHKANKEQRLFDSTEGGSKKKGTSLITLEKYLNTYAKKKIDKSVLVPFLSLSPGYSEKINKTMDMLKIEINNLKEIINNCEKGTECANKMGDENISREDFLKYSKDNETYANRAHELSKGNSLMGVAIFHSSRKIYSREYILDAANKKKFSSLQDRKKFTENHMFKNIEDRKAGVEKSIMILKAAKEAAEKLIPMYEEVQNIFNKYIETGDESVFISQIIKEINFEDAEEYLAVGNWAHVLVDIKNVAGCPDFKIDKTLVNKVNQMRDQSIKEAKESSKKERRQDIFDYLYYVEEGQRLGREEKKFQEAIKFLKKAEKLFPKKLDARWGLASAYLHEKHVEKSMEYFEKLHNDFPEFPRLSFEYGISLLEYETEQEEPNIKKALKYITEAMSKSSEFNHFFKALGDLYGQMGEYKKAQAAYEEYKKYYPADYSINYGLAECYKKLGEYKKARKLLK